MKHLYDIYEHLSPTFFNYLKVLLIITFLSTAAFLTQKIIKNSLKKLKFIDQTNQIIIAYIITSIVFIIFSAVAFDFFKMELKSLTFMSGALFLGVGFGIQKLASNFISGLILLFDKSIRVGNIIEMKDSIYGRVQNIGILHTVIETQDLKEIMVPNETLLTQNVTNCTTSKVKDRLEFKINIHYESDVELAMNLLIKIAAAHPNANPQFKPKCSLKEFGAYGIDLLLYVWVEDIFKYRSLVRNDINLAILKTFKENNIEIPYPIYKIHLVKE